LWPGQNNAIGTISRTFRLGHEQKANTVGRVQRSGVVDVATMSVKNVTRFGISLFYGAALLRFAFFMIPSGCAEDLAPAIYVETIKILSLAGSIPGWENRIESDEE
jgi:hypothetical protein